MIDIIIKEISFSGRRVIVLGIGLFYSIIVALTPGYAICMSDRHHSINDDVIRAIKTDDIAVFRDVLQYEELDVDSVLQFRGDDVSILGLAVIHDSIRIIDFLLNANADVELSIRTDLLPPLQLACSACSGDAIELLLEHGFDINDDNNRHSMTCIFFAVHCPSCIVERIIDSGAKLDVRDFRNKGVLHHAAQRGNPDVIEFLLDHDLDANDESGGATPLDLAIEHCQCENIKVLWHHGARLSHMMEETFGSPLAHSVGCSPDIFEFFLAQGLDPNASDENGRSVLVYAIRHHNAYRRAIHRDDYHAEIVSARVRSHRYIELLLEHGADPNLADEDGITPLMHAARTNTVIVQLLLGAGADADHIDNNGATALHYLAEDPKPPDYVVGETLSIIQVLIASGVDPERLDNNNMFAVERARMAGAHDVVVEMLRMHASEVDVGGVHY